MAKMLRQHLMAVDVHSKSLVRIAIEKIANFAATKSKNAWRRRSYAITRVICCVRMYLGALEARSRNRFTQIRNKVLCD